MPAPTRSPQSRPPRYYYLGRPATWWLTALPRQAQQRAEDGKARVPTP